MVAPCDGGAVVCCVSRRDRHIGRNEDRDLVLFGHKLMGYRCVVTRVEAPERVRPGDKLRLCHSWENRAMGRCHARCRLGVYLMWGEACLWQGTDDRFDPRAMISGRAYDLVSEFGLPGELAPGLYELRSALLDENNNVPAVRLAVDGDDGHQRYVVGRVEVAPDAPDIEPNSEIRLDGGSAQWFAAQELGPGTDALVSFRYEVTGDPARDLDSQDPGYFRFCALGADHARVNEFRWFDKAGQPPAWLTVLVSTDAAAPYRLVWEPVGGGTLRVSEARIETLAPGTVRRLAVEDLDLAEGARIEQAVRVAFEHDRSQVRLPDDWQPYLRTSPEHVPLRPNTVYAVWFNAVARPQLWQGDYHYLHVRAPGDSAPPQHPTFCWMHRHTDQPVTRTYTFRTGPEEGTILERGIKNGGAARISEIRIVELGGP